MPNEPQHSPIFDGEPLLTTVEASEYSKSLGLSVAPATLTTQRCKGGGPKFLKFGPSVRYRKRHLDEHAVELLGEPVSSTSELRR